VAARDEVLTARGLPVSCGPLSDCHCKAMKKQRYVIPLRRAAAMARNLLITREGSTAAAENHVVIYMDDYRKAQAMSVAPQYRYDEELLCVNWNPAIRVFAMSCYQNNRELSPELPEDFSKIDADAFLSRVYALATQV
jgi:hypothetical protein